MKLSTVNDEYLIELMSWFTTESELNQWSGPNFEYPFTLESFKRDLRLNALSSLVVSPSARGKGVIAQLISALTVSGKKLLGVNSSSLFVMADNQSAIQAYQKAGFSLSTYPEKIPLENCLYMTSAD